MLKRDAAVRRGAPSRITSAAASGLENSAQAYPHG